MPAGRGRRALPAPADERRPAAADTARQEPRVWHFVAARILDYLVRRGVRYPDSIRCQELASALSISPGCARDHLRALMVAGLVGARRGRGGGYYHTIPVDAHQQSNIRHLHDLPSGPGPGGSPRRRPLSSAIVLARQLQMLARRLTAIEEETKRRVALEIHDGIAQTATMLFLRIQATERILPRSVNHARRYLVQAKDMAQEIVDALSFSIFSTSPPRLDEMGLNEALRLYVEQYERTFGIKVSVDIVGSPDQLGTDASVTIYRVIQEALTNVRKHADTSRAFVTLVFAGSEVRGEVRDEGRGFDLAATASRTYGLGLRGMQERLRWLGGRLEIHSQPGRGTTVAFVLPCAGRW